MNKANNDEAKMKSLMVEMGLNAKTVAELKSIGRMQGMQMRLPWSIEIR